MLSLLLIGVDVADGERSVARLRQRGKRQRIVAKYLPLPDAVQRMPFRVDRYLYLLL